jgi:hypothetical protein
MSTRGNRPYYDPYANDPMGGYDIDSYSDSFQGLAMFRERGYTDSELPSELQSFAKFISTPEWQRNLEKFASQAGNIVLEQGGKALEAAPSFIFHQVINHLMGDLLNGLHHHSHEPDVNQNHTN